MKNKAKYNAENIMNGLADLQRSPVPNAIWDNLVQRIEGYPSKPISIRSLWMTAASIGLLISANAFVWRLNQTKSKQVVIQNLIQSYGLDQQKDNIYNF